MRADTHFGMIRTRICERHDVRGVEQRLLQTGNISFDGKTRLALYHVRLMGLLSGL